MNDTCVVYCSRSSNRISAVSEKECPLNLVLLGNEDLANKLLKQIRVITRINIILVCGINTRLMFAYCEWTLSTLVIDYENLDNLKIII